MGKNKNQNKKKTNPILWLFFAVIIPIFIAGALTIFVLNISGVDVLGWTKAKGEKIPVISSLIKDEDSDAESKQDAKKQETEEEIKRLKEEIKELEEQNDNLKQDYLKLENEKNSMERLLDETEEESEAVGKPNSSPAKDTANAFRKMKPKQAALIIQDLEASRANDILNELSNDVRGKILQEMDPDKARSLINVHLDQS